MKTLGLSFATALTLWLALINRRNCADNARLHKTSALHGTHIGHVRRINEDALFVNERKDCGW